jgi:hypothetical protein
MTIVIDAPVQAAGRSMLIDHQIIGSAGEAQRALSAVLGSIQPQKTSLQQAFNVQVGSDERTAFAVHRIELAGVETAKAGTNMLVSCSNANCKQLVARRAAQDGCSPELAATRLLREYLVAEIHAYLTPSVS